MLRMKWRLNTCRLGGLTCLFMLLLTILRSLAGNLPLLKVPIECGKWRDSPTPILQLIE